MLNRKGFFDATRSSLFGGAFTPAQVTGLSAILTGWEKSYAERTPPTQLAYCLATAYHETATRMQPIHEFGSPAYFTKLYDVQGANPARARAMGNTSPGDGAKYCGRGLVQLTWKSGYAKATPKLQALGILKPTESLVDNPELALRMDVAVALLFEGMSDGWFTGVDLGDVIDGKIDGDEHSDFIRARRIINGSDRADIIASYADKFLMALEGAST